MTREDLIELFDKYKETFSKYEKNKKIIREIENDIDKITKSNNTKITASYKEIQSGKTNAISNTVESSVEKKDEEIKELEIQKKTLEAENIILKNKIEDVEIVLKALKFKEKTVIVEHYIEGNTYEDIGNRVFWKIYGQTRNWEAIKKISDRAMEKMLKI